MPPETSPELKRVQQQHNNCLALKGVLQTVDRALSGVEDLRVNIVGGYSVPAPAWTDGKVISMSREMVFKVFEDKPLPEAMLIFKGTNFHELAHVMFTPSKDDAIAKWNKAEQYKYKWAWNALEDQRIETLYTALYPPTVPYFRNMAYHWLLEDTVDKPHFYRLYSLIGGRKYLDRSVRRTARQAFVDHYGAEIADRLDEVVNEYIGLPLPGSTYRAIELVKEFYELLKGTGCDQEHGTCGGENAGENSQVDPEKVIEAASKVRDQVEQDKAQDKADGPQKPREGQKGEQQSSSAGGYPEDDQDDEEDDAQGGGGSGDWDDEDDWDEDDEDEGDQDGDSGSDSDSEGEQADGEADGGSQADKGDQDGPEGQTRSSESARGATAGDPNTPPPPPEPVDPARELQDAINEALADTLTDQDLKDDLDRAVEAFKANGAGKGQAEEQPEYTRFQDVDCTDDTAATVQKIIAQLRMLKTDAEPAWIKERLSGGRVNVNHVIRHTADPTHLEIFEEWDEGYEEEAKTEVVIAIDLSLSMVDVLPQCSQALYALKKSFDKIEVPTTVLGFSPSNVVLYGRDEKIKGLKVREFQAWSGTNPRDTILYAHRLLARSQTTNKVLIAITDGIWSGVKNDGADPENVVEDIRKRGGSTLLFGVNGHQARDQEHNFEICTTITEIGDIVKVIKELVVNIQKKAGNNKK